MTGQNNDWSQWGEMWREQPAVDGARLRRLASHKRWRMRIMMTLEIATSLGASVQCLWLMTHISGRWWLWSAASLLMIMVVQSLYLHVRRGTWRASGDDVTSLLRLTLQRAVAGIRLAKLNLWTTLIWVVVTLLVSLPELAPSHWRADPKLKFTLILQFAVNGPLILALVAFFAWYIRRQRKRIARVQAMLSLE